MVIWLGMSTINEDSAGPKRVPAREREHEAEILSDCESRFFLPFLEKQ